MSASDILTIITAGIAGLGAIAGTVRAGLSWAETRARERLLREQAVKTIEAKNAEIASLEAELRHRDRQVLAMSTETAQLRARLEAQS